MAGTRGGSSRQGDSPRFEADQQDFHVRKHRADACVLGTAMGPEKASVLAISISQAFYTTAAGPKLPHQAIFNFT